MIRVICFVLLAIAAATTSVAQVNITLGDDSVEIEINGEPFTAFYTDGYGLRKPYLHPLRAASGTYVTRMWPMEEVEEEVGTEKDHPHHRGLWFAHDPVSGVNFWASDTSNQSPNQGRIAIDEIRVLETGGDAGSVAAASSWQTPDGETMVTEARTMRFHGDESLRMIDFDITLTAAREVEFADSKEGTLGLRVRPVMEEDGGTGRIVNAEGLVGEDQAWGKPSKWCDYSGEINGEALGIAILDHPENPNHPVRWHVRGYGLFAANPFGLAAFTGNDSETGGIRLAAGESLRFRYRVVIHPGDAASADVESLWTAYADAN